jgi:hypothetical protein
MQGQSSEERRHLQTGLLRGPPDRNTWTHGLVVCDSDMQRNCGELFCAAERYTAKRGPREGMKEMRTLSSAGRLIRQACKFGRFLP